MEIKTMLFLNENKSSEKDTNDAIINELDKMITDDESIVAEDFDVFDGDAAGSMELCLEMETSWDALIMDMASIEHASIVNEDEMLLEGKMKSFWDTIVKWAKRVWVSISGFFKKALNFITSHYKNAEKWIADNKDKIDEGKSVEFKCYDEVASGNALKNIQTYMKSVKQGAEAIVNSAGAKSAGKEFKEENKDLLGKLDKRTVKVSTLMGNIKGSNQGIADLKSSQAMMAAQLKKIINDANAAKNNAKSEDVKKAKELISARKKALSLFQKATSRAIKSYSGVISQSLTGVRKSLSEKK